MGSKFILTHLINRNLKRIIATESLGDFEKAWVENDFSFSFLEVDFFKMEGLIKSPTFSVGLSCVGTIQISLKWLV